MRSKSGPALKTFSGLLAAGLLALVSAGCMTSSAPLPPVNLAEPGWTLRQGQALWRIRADAPELAGEVLSATHADGRALLQFTKTPLPFVSVQLATNGVWQVDFIPQQTRYTGQGRPFPRLIWAHLARALSGQPLPSPIEFTRPENHGWRLLNRDSGESITGFFNP